MAVIIAAGPALLDSDGVVARGPNVGSQYDILAPRFSQGARSLSWPAERSGPGKALAEGPPICVRLCDGGFFPISTVSGYPSEEAACQSLCPDASTAVYHQASGSDRIDDAISAAGESYTALPAAFMYRSTRDATCACHRAAAPAYALARDPTLRKGDYVMTANGFAVFAGNGDIPHRANDFIAIADAKIPARDRNALSAMDSAGLRASIEIAPSAGAEGARR